MIRVEFLKIAIRELKPKYGRHRAKKLAWQLLKAIEKEAEPADSIILETLNCCPNCLSSGWLMKDSEGDITCFNCMDTFLVIE